MTEKRNTVGGALITGAGRRLGAGLARCLAAEGWDLVLHANASRHDADELAAALSEGHGVEVTVLEADLSDLNGLDRLMRAGFEAAPALRLLVNNASIFPYDNTADVTPSLLGSCFAVNCAAPVLLSRYFAAELAKIGGATRGGRASIVNVLDNKIHRPDGEFLSYELSKNALAAATTGLARSLAPIRVNAVAPGLTLPSGNQSEATFRRVHRQTPLGYGPEPLDIAAAVSYLATARAVTGQMLTVDCGSFLNGDHGEAAEGMK